VQTTSLTAVRDAAEREGYHVEGFAPSHAPYTKLAEAGIRRHDPTSSCARDDHAPAADENASTSSTIKPGEHEADAHVPGAPRAGTTASCLWGRSPA